MLKEHVHLFGISKIEKILHIADVHIRNFKRHDEYNSVFESLYELCREKVAENKNTIIYLAGDIVHAKTDMTPELISMVTNFLDTLSRIAPTILIAGNHDCYTPDHEVLTKNGWMTIADYVNNNCDYEVASFNSDERSISFEKPISKIKKHFSGDMVHISGKNVDMLVTPEHRVIHHTASNDKLYTKTAKEIKRNMYIPVNGNSEPSERNIFAELLGFSFADATFVKKSGNAKRIQFHLKKNRKIEYLSSLLTQLNYEFNINESSNDSFVINVCGDLARDIYSFFDGKKELNWSLLNNPTDFLKSFVNGYLNGDGSKRPDMNFYTFTNISQNTVEILSTVIHLIGGVSRYNPIGKMSGNYENSKLQYSANATFSDKMKTTTVKEVKNVPYNDDVYCLTVPSSYLLIRRNGKIFVSGNCNLNNMSRMDALSPIVSLIDSDFNQLNYLKETGVYTIGDIDFVLNSVYEEPENFILAKDVQSDNKKIVLFHGAIDMSSTDSGNTMKNKSITIEKFAGFDYGMFGDIHKFQYLEPTCKFAYAGSLIQQNFGEGLIHGIIEWDIKNDRSNFIRIKNDWTYHTVEVDNGVVREYPTEYSKFNCIRIKSNNTNNSDIFNIVTELKSRANIVDIRVQRISNKLTNQLQINTNPIGDVRDVEHQNSLIKDFIRSRYNVTDDILEKIANINRNINTKLSESDIVRNLIWQPIYFEFDNMFSYGEGNTIDFSDMNGVYGLFAANASGKSSIMDAIMFCIFDKCSRTYKASQVLNNSKETFRCKFNFMLAGKSYWIERTGIKDKKGNVKVNVDFWSEEDGVKTSLNGQDRDSTNFVVRKYLGTYDDFIITTMSLQGNNTNFVDKAQRERKDLLAQFLDLDLFEELNSIASDDIKSVQTLIKEFSKKDYSSKIAESKIKFKKYSTQLDELIDDRDLTNKAIQDLSDEVIKLNKKLIPIDVNLENKSLEDLESKRESLVNKGKSVKIEIQELESEIKTLNSKANDYRVSLSNIDRNSLIEKRDKIDSLKTDLAKYESDVRAIKSSINHCESKIDNLKSHEYDPNCKFCVNNVFVKDAKKAENDLEGFMEDLQLTQSKVNEIENQIKSGITVYTELDKLYHIENGLFDVEKQIHNLEKTLYSKNDSKKELIDSITKIDELIKRYHENQDAILKNETVLKQLKEIEKEKYNLSTLRLKELENKIIECSGEVKVYQQIINECNESINKLKELETEFHAYDYYLKAVNRNGVPYELIAQALPKVQAETNNILSNIVDFQVLFDTDGKSINTYIVYDDENYWALELSSGMEKFISSLAIRTALINISSLPRPNFMVIDEGLGSLDATVLNNFSLFLDYLKTHMEFIILISHIDVVRDIVDSQIDIKKEKGFSSINV